MNNKQHTTLNYKQLTYLLLLIFLFPPLSHAQEIFLSQGKIEFEKKVNIHKNMEDDAEGEQDDMWRQMIKKMSPEYKLSYFDLYFNASETLYQPGREIVEVQKVPDWFLGPANDNVVYQNLTTKQSISQKNVFESKFLIQDSTRAIDWRITTDTRTIAGFECRKAVGRILDSIYIIAFYTDQVITTGGPESFQGLPGMILGLAIPRIHTTWFATKIETTPPTPQQIAPPAKGKKVTSSLMQEQLKPAMKNWGKEGKRNMWLVLL